MPTDTKLTIKAGWKYSSASNYEGEQGLIEVSLLDAVYGW